MAARTAAPHLLGAGLLALAACNVAETVPLGGLQVPDGGLFFPDTGWLPLPDAGPWDGGPWDAGAWDGGPLPDAGPVCRRPTASGECECNPQVGLLPFEQADCPDPRDVCVPWDDFAWRDDLVRPFARCTRPCFSNADCAAGQSCWAADYPAGSGVARVCVDAVADYDEVCSGTRVTPREAATATREVRQPGVVVGCVAGTTCVRGLLPDGHIDEGVCLGLCDVHEDCAAPTPYCNPRLLEGFATPAGVCSQAQLGRGALCSTGGPQQKVGLTAQCDTSLMTPVNTVCAGADGLVGEGLGICITLCNSDAECPLEGPQATCSSLGQDFGFCTDGCTSALDTCVGPGQGLGRTCMDYVGDENGQTIGLCMDRLPPPLRPAVMDLTGNILDPGDNCFPQPSTDFLRCPEPASCILGGLDMGLCMYGCLIGAPGADAECAQILGPGAACVAVGGDPQQSFCGAP
ncbi:MAG: hypothetical protein H6730_37400 [Deltaproteobacteria bacterium]|nr:hypothetical protein [Deltaproteobacteria bacterium]